MWSSEARADELLEGVRFEAHNWNMVCKECVKGVLGVCKGRVRGVLGVCKFQN